MGIQWQSAGMSVQLFARSCHRITSEDDRRGLRVVASLVVMPLLGDLGTVAIRQPHDVIRSPAVLDDEPARVALLREHLTAADLGFCHAGEAQAGNERGRGESERG